MSLATKYRPAKWKDVVGQNIVVDILQKQLEQNKLKNCYIFSGASGCGKTTVARLFANEVNHHTGKPIEIDAASNNGVDNAKFIVKSASERALDAEYKIYILDEAHMLTTQAWNALLKTIEEPPKHTMFIFCTTDPHKIPDTIQNRCIRFNFNRINSNLIYDRLCEVSNMEGFTNYTDTCEYISRICNGEMRNALSLLEKCADMNTNLDINSTINVLGKYSYDILFKLINSIIDGDINGAISVLEDLNRTGSNITVFVDTFLEFCFDIMKYLITQSLQSTKIPNIYLNDMNNCINFENAVKYYNYYVDSLLELKNMLKTDSNAFITTEIIITKMCRLG